MSKAKLHWMNPETGFVHGQEWHDACLPEVRARLVPCYFLPYPDDVEIQYLRDRIWPGREVKTKGGFIYTLTGAPPIRIRAVWFVPTTSARALKVVSIDWPEDQPKRVMLTWKQIRSVFPGQGGWYDWTADAIFAAGEEVHGE